MDTNQMMLLSDSLQEVRNKSNDKDINNKLQDKKYMELAEDMAKISRAANTCAGIFFDMYMSNKPKDDGKPLVAGETNES